MRSRRPPLLPTIAGLILAVLLALPGTRWLLLAQIRMQVAPPDELRYLLYDLGVQGDIARKPPGPDSAPIQRVAARAPADYGLQIAAANDADSEKHIANLRALESKFSDRPSIYAQSLRYACQRQISLKRPAEEDIISPPSKGPQPWTPPPFVPSTPQALHTALAEATAGEKLDPKNGFFPTMAAFVLFALHRDAEALAALHRAAGAPRWDDYTRDEARGGWRAAELAYGRQTAVQRTAIQAALLFPHLAKMRAMARVAAGLAVERERAGDRAGGMKIRIDLGRLGATMRAESPTLIGSLVGIAITAISRSHPGGKAPVLPTTLPSEERARRQWTAFADYARQAGYPDEAAITMTQYEAGLSARHATQAGLDRSPVAGTPMFQLLLLWVGGMIVLANVLWFLLVGGLAGVLARNEASGRATVALAILALGGLFVVAIMQSSWAEAIVALGEVVRNLTSQSGPGAGLPLIVVRAMSVGATVALPILVTAVSLPSAAVRRAPLAAGLRAGALFFAVLMLFAYAVITQRTLAGEARTNYGLERMVTDEGRYMAELAGQRWPGRDG